MKKLLLILLCLPLLFSCGENNKEQEEKWRKAVVEKKEKEERTVDCFLRESSFYNYQRFDGYKEFKFGDNISNFSNHLIPYNASWTFPDANNHYHLNPLFQAISSYNWVQYLFEGNYRCSFEADSFQDVVKRIARGSVRGGFSKYNYYYYKDNISRTFLGHHVKDIILGFKDSNLEQIILILPPPFDATHKLGGRVRTLEELNSRPYVHYLSRYTIGQSLQDRFGVENKWKFECMDHFENGGSAFGGMYFSTTIFGYRPDGISVSNELVDRGISISLDSYKFNYNNELQTANIVTLVSDKSRYERAVRLNNDL
jgi:hypothetical protein